MALLMMFNATVFLEIYNYVKHLQKFNKKKTRIRNGWHIIYNAGVRIN